MSYQVLARKYRPRSFDTLVGQEHVVRALTHALEQKRLHHAYLFTGTRGVGKTTLSRILAKSLNCQGVDGQGDVTSNPCGQCDACIAIDAGRFVDYIEMDAASNRGVDEMAQLLEQAVYAPSNARYKIYMIDEVHMLTNHAFNAMLKTLEEPPAHVKFILATTDPQKIPVTVLSRCLQFNLKQMPPGHIVGHLENILGQEAIEFDTPALRLLAQGAQGSMRDALSLTDQAIAYSAGRITLEAVQGMLGTLDQSYLIRLMDALAAGDGAGLLAIADEMAERSLSYQTALQDLGSLLHRIALAQSVPAAVPEDLPEREHILRLASALDPEEVQLHYQIAVHGRNELGLAPDEYAGFTMTLLRMLAFKPAQGGAAATPRSASVAGPARTSAAAAAQSASQTTSAVSRAGMAATATVAPNSTDSSSAGRPALSPARAALEAARGAGRQNETRNTRSTLAVPPTPQAVQPAARPAAIPDGIPPWLDEPMMTAAPADTARNDASVAVMERAPDVLKQEQVMHERTKASVPSFSKAAEAPPLMVQHAEAQAAVEVLIAPVLIPGCDRDWPTLAAALPLRGVVQQLALQSELIRCESAGNGLALHLKIPVDTLRSGGGTEKLEAALTECLEKPVQVSTEVGAARITASAFAAAAREQRQREAEEQMRKDPFVQTLMREFGATIVPGSVKPN